ncbi:MAG TPA: GGDEF domain-containing protein [Candidatus Acidoferrales bacterium]|nr:GGDEF domain-containing protein [Candidatus Acidoferrales bacterium]
MPMPTHKLDKGIPNGQDLAASVAQSIGATNLSLGMDPGPHFDFDVPALDLPRGKEAVEQILQTVFAKANGELAKLLQDVRTKSAAGQLGTAQNGSANKLLMRAVQCAVNQYMLQAELGSLALSDELTGVYNRRGFLALAERQLKLGRRSGRAILVFFADVDGLKQINDKFGHKEGDLALVHAAEVLEKTFRDSDVIARFGGDEFAVLALEVSGHSESTIRARLKQNLEELNAKRSPCTLSISLGAVRFDPTNPRSPASIEQLMIRADEAMYEEKRLRTKPFLVTWAD